jgi:DNA (cytosine-5)-methyltransferase 1
VAARRVADEIELPLMGGESSGQPVRSVSVVFCGEAVPSSLLWRTSGAAALAPRARFTHLEASGSNAPSQSTHCVLRTDLPLPFPEPAWELARTMTRADQKPHPKSKREVAGRERPEWGFAPRLSVSTARPPRVYPLDEQSVFHARCMGALVGTRARFRLIDLFAGAGGMTLGFTKAFGHAFQPVWANDFSRDACRTYAANFGGHCHEGNIVDLLEDPEVTIPRADVVIGGPPCQGFSLLNKNREGDSRKELWRPYLEVVRRSRASVFVMENVPQLLGSEEHAAILSEAKALGFQLAWTKLLAADYGVPQRRTRAFIIGCRFADPSESVFPPRPSHYEAEGSRDALRLGAPKGASDARPWRTVRDAIADLGRPVGTEVRDESGPHDLHFGRKPTAQSLERYKAIPEEGMNRFDLQQRRPDITPGCWIRKTSGGTDLFGRLWWDRPAFTLRTEFFKPEKGRYLHPRQHRPITHREAARLQTFPDTFEFKGTKIEIARQIGNAVPPLLASRIADSVYALLLARKKT